MYRSCIEQLIEWKNDPNRKPLILRGARQVGKTWLLKHFGAEHFQQTAYIQLLDNPNMEELFSGSLSPERLLRGLSLASGVDIHPETTLIILDEIQSIPRALTSLKFFCEDAPEYAIATAGSLLGVALNNDNSFPVGKVNFIDLYPLNFKEFLMSTGDYQLLKVINSTDTDMYGLVNEQAIEMLRLYYFVGGMPEAVKTFVESGRNFDQVRKIHLNILDSYERDFSKHTGYIFGERCRLIFNSIPKHLAKPNHKFVYGLVKSGARGRDLDDALQFLVDAGLVIKVKLVSTAQIPLKAFSQDNQFKLFCLDVGLLAALSQIDANQLIHSNEFFSIYKGAIAEQFVCQQLISMFNIEPYYWSNTKNTAEVDFVIQTAGKIIPIEVKAEENLRAKSLASFCKQFNIKQALRLSLSPYRKESWLQNLPLYAINALFDFVSGYIEQG